MMKGCRSGITLSILTVLGCLATAGTAFAAGAAPDRPVVVTKPVAEKRVRPVYPRSQSSELREGWVAMRLTVKADGSVADLVAVDSSGDGDFVSPALTAVRQWRFKPATRDGQPVDFENHTVFVTFVMDVARSKRGAQGKVVDGLRDVDRLIAEKRLEEAEAKLARLESGSIFLYEYPFLYLRMASLALAEGDPDRALVMMQRAIQLDDVVEAGTRHTIMANAIRLQVQLGHYKAALDMAERLEVKEGGSIPPDLAETLGKVRALAADPTPIAVPARIGRDCGYERCAEGQGSWMHKPLRGSFALASVDGRLDEIRASCDHKTFTAKAEVGLSWTIPESWGSCRIRVTGAPGTSFQFVAQ